VDTIAALCYGNELVDALRLQIPEIVIIDNGSPTPIEGAIRLDANYYFSGGWNRAMRILRERYNCDYVWMLNSDVTGIHPAMFSSIVEKMKRCGCGVMTPAFNSPHQHMHKISGTVRSVRWVDWACPVVAWWAWEKVGDFDESMPGYGADLDWCRRAREMRITMFVDESFMVNHIGGATSQAYGLVDVIANVEQMNRELSRKWGVKSWVEMT